MKADFKTVDEYFDSLQPTARAALTELREIIRSAAPDAEECLSYKIPAFRQNGILVYYAAFNDHYSLFPANVTLITEMFGPELKAYATSKGTIQFPVGKPFPATLIREIVKARVEDNSERAASKAKSKR